MLNKYNHQLDNTNEPIIINGMSFSSAEVLKVMDPIAYNEGYRDFIDNLIKEFIADNNLVSLVSVDRSIISQTLCEITEEDNACYEVTVMDNEGNQLNLLINTELADLFSDYLTMIESEV